jgi:DHA3 family macrolide efflux protein-like MFS transporter
MRLEHTEKPHSLRPFFTLWIGQVFSLLGSQIVQFALIWWLTQQTGSATVLAIASVVGLVPQVVLGPFVGPLIDRWNRKWTMIVADSFVALSTLGLIYLYGNGMAETWHIYVALFIRALGGAFHWPAMTASTSLMVPQEHLTRIQGLNQILNGGLSIASAPIGALVISLLPMQGVLMIDVVTAILAVSTIVLVRIPQPLRDASHETSAASSAYLSDLRDGLRYMLNWRGLLMIAGLAMLVNMVLSPTNSFMPLLVTEHFSGIAWHLGILEAGFGIGVLAGGLLLSVWGGFKRRTTTSLIGLAGIGLGILIVGLSPATLFPLAVAGMVVVGVMSSLCNGPITAILQAIVEPSMQGRVFTLVGSASAAMMPLGLAVSGPLADVIGVRTCFVIGGLITLLAGVAAFFVPAVVNIEEDREKHAPAGESLPASMTNPIMEPVESA